MYVVKALRLGAVHAENMVRREFLLVSTRAGLRRIRFHDLRHTYTTLLLAQVGPVHLRGES